jgi:hypothetical protein
MPNASGIVAVQRKLSSNLQSLKYLRLVSDPISVGMEFPVNSVEAVGSNIACAWKDEMPKMVRCTNYFQQITSSKQSREESSIVATQSKRSSNLPRFKYVRLVSDPISVGMTPFSVQNSVRHNIVNGRVR